MANRNSKIKCGKVEVGDEINVKINPNLKEISKILKSKDLKALDFKKGLGRIIFSADIDWDPKKRRDWSLHVLPIPNLTEPEHEHYLFDLKEMKKIRTYIDGLIKKIEDLE